jgi:SPP1 family predicted phage head-tail adaptor
MGAGQLNTVITFRRNTPTKDSTGQMIDSWADAFSVYAEKITEGGREFYAAQKRNAEVTAVYRIRFRRGIDTKMRVRHGCDEYEILPPLVDEKNKHQWLLVSVKSVK